MTALVYGAGLSVTSSTVSALGRSALDPGCYESARSTLEEEIRIALGAAAIRRYGPEVLGFLYAQEKHDTVVDDAFSQLCEDLWKGIASFEQRSSFRTWMYMVARAALHRTRRTTIRREKRQASLSTWEEAAVQVRSELVKEQLRKAAEREGLL